MANPRKFSEKIALHNQKQAEETAEFEKIMREVSDATNKDISSKKQHLRINQSLGAFRAGSLPNVNNFSSSTPLELKSSINNTEEMKNMAGAGIVAYKDRDRNTLGPMRSRPGEKRIDKSPYSGSYLSPPPDTSWRRTHSDSALHTSSHETSNQRREIFHGSSLLCLRSGALTDVFCKGLEKQLLDGYEIGKKNLPMCNIDGRPRSSSNVSRGPGMSLFPSQQDPEGVQIPISNNTGSLPDLTCIHFPSPLNIPLDQDEHSSPYTNSSQCGSPSSVSPTSLPQPCSGRFSFGGTPPHEAPGPPPQYANTGITHQPYQQQYVYQQPLSPSQQQYSPQHSLQTYRTSVKRPSPQTSPALTVKYSTTPRSNSPQSPPSPCSIGGGMNFAEVGCFISQAQANALQHHFEQFTMEDGCTQIGEVTTDPGYFSTSPSQHLQYPRGPHPASTQTTPNTPSSIPDIVLTDFSNGDELAKDLGVAMAGPLDADLFPTDECLREGLVPIDLDGLQMLTDPEIITDPATEDHFRLDRL